MMNFGNQQPNPKEEVKAPEVKIAPPKSTVFDKQQWDGMFNQLNNSFQTNPMFNTERSNHLQMDLTSALNKEFKHVNMGEAAVNKDIKDNNHGEQITSAVSRASLDRKDASIDKN